MRFQVLYWFRMELFDDGGIPVMALLTVRDLSIDFLNGGVRLPVVDRVSFSVEEGGITALVGESGCGKSASCLALTRLLPSPPALPRAEAVGFLSSSGPVDLLKIPARRLRKLRGGEIAYIFQEPSTSLNPVMRIGDQIAEVLELHAPEVTDRRAEVIRLLGLVGIPAPEERCRAFPHELSGGMQQRVMIAMALAGSPRLLIADEPTTALDVTIQAQILELIARLRRERGLTVILITHNLGIVASLADRVEVMYAGWIVESAPARELIDSPRHPYTRALLAAVPKLGGGDAPLETIPGMVPPPSEFPAGCRFCDRCRRAAGLSPEAREKCRTVPPPWRDFGGRGCRCHWTEAEGA